MRALWYCNGVFERRTMCSLSKFVKEVANTRLSDGFHGGKDGKSMKRRQNCRFPSSYQLCFASRRYRRYSCRGWSWYYKCEIDVIEESLTLFAKITGEASKSRCVRDKSWLKVVFLERITDCTHTFKNSYRGLAENVLIDVLLRYTIHLVYIWHDSWSRLNRTEERKSALR